MAPTSPITYTEFARRENDEFTVGVDDLGNYFARKTDPASVWENLYKAGTTATMENASELLGLDLAKGVGAIGRRAEKLIGKTKAGRALEMIRSRMGEMPALKRWDNYMGETFKWYGMPVELMTEEYSAFLEPIATGEPERIRENFSSAAQWDLALSVIGMGAAFNAARLPVAVYDHVQYRRRAGTLLGKIENPDIRKQVSRAMQQTTRSGQATELEKVDWENASLRDMAAATDYVAHKTQGQATQAIRDAMREQAQAKAAVERFEQLKNRDTGKAEEVTDTQGNRFFLAGGTIEKEAAAQSAAPDAEAGAPRAGIPMTQRQAQAFIDRMQQTAPIAPELELTPENWLAEFGENGMVDTPIGRVKMGDNQFEKMRRIGRSSKLGMVKPTLTDPDVVIRDASRAAQGQTERPSSYVFVKAFTGANGERIYHFTSATVSRNGQEVVISNQ